MDALQAQLADGPPRAICPHMTLARDAADLPERIVRPIS
jgi:hypothetical protein